MIKMLNNQLCWVWLLLIATATLTSCSSEDEFRQSDIVSPSPHKAKVWTVKIDAGKTNNGITRGVFSDDEGATLKTKWLGTETFTVYYNDAVVGTVTAAASESPNTILTGELDDADYTEGGEFKLSPIGGNYLEQDGTLENLSEKDYLEQTTVSISKIFAGNELITTSAHFTRKQSFFKFTFNQNVTSVTIFATGLANGPLTITPESATNTIYAALSNTSEESQIYSFSAEVGGETYTCPNAKTIDIGKGNYYAANISLSAPPAGLNLATLKTWFTNTWPHEGSLKTPYLNYYVNSSGALSKSSSGAIGVVAYLGKSDVETGVNGTQNIIVIATSDASTGCSWGPYYQMESDVPNIWSYETWNGYASTQKLYQKSTTNYPAAKYAWEYQNKKGSAVVSGSSGWFLPSVAQARAITSRGAGRSCLPTAYAYWCCTEYPNETSESRQWWAATIYAGTGATVDTNTHKNSMGPHVRAVFVY